MRLYDTVVFSIQKYSGCGLSSRQSMCSSGSIPCIVGEDIEFLGRREMGDVRGPVEL